VQLLSRILHLWVALDFKEIVDKIMGGAADPGFKLWV
jgi:hypothetical protein